MAVYSNFLYATGTNGFITATFDLLTTELNTLTSASGVATSSVGGTSGKFSQSNTGSAIQSNIWFTSGGSFTPTAGGYLAGWFLKSHDGGTTFETLIATASSTVPALPRAPDFTIPLYEGGTALASGNIKYAQGPFVLLPVTTFKLVVQNLAGANLPASGNKISIGPAAVGY